jgi:hypothetical protein
MSENNVNKNVRDDEIDLLDLFRSMGKTLNRWFQTLGRIILISLVFILKHWLPLVISIVAGIGISYVLKTTSVSFFTSDLVFRNNLAKMDYVKLTDISGTTSEIISKINKLHTFCLEKNQIALSEALTMMPESVRNISDISAFWIIDLSKDNIPDYVDYKGDHSAADTTNIRMQDRLDIRVRIKSPQDLNLIRDGIIKFIESDSLYQQRNRVRIRQNNELLARLDYDIIQLDSLQKIKYFEETKAKQQPNGGQMIFIQEQKTQLIYTDIYILYARKQVLESERDLYKGIVTILSDFSSPRRRDNGTLFYAKKFVPIIFCVVLLVLILIANFNKLKEIYNKY